MAKLTANQIKKLLSCNTSQMGNFNPLHSNSDKILDVFGLIGLWMNGTDEENYSVSFTNESINIIWMNSYIYSFSIMYTEGFCVLRADCAPTDISELIVDICRTLGCDKLFFA
jgi:hypothetical protein